MTVDTSECPIPPLTERRTEWEFRDPAAAADLPVHVAQTVYVNGKPLDAHLCIAEPVVVMTSGGFTRGETLLRITVHPDDVTWSERRGERAPDTVGGVPILVPLPHAEQSWCHVVLVEPVEVRPNGSSYARKRPGTAERDLTAHWVRLHVQVASVSFT